MKKIVIFTLLLICAVSFHFIMVYATTYCNCGTIYPVAIYNPPNDYRLYDINNYTGINLWTYFLSPHNYEVIDYVKGHSYPSNYTAYLKTLNGTHYNYTQNLSDILSISDSINLSKTLGNQSYTTITPNYLKINSAPELAGNADSHQFICYVYSGVGVDASLDCYNHGEYFVISQHKTDTYQFTLTNSGTIFVPPEGQQTTSETLAEIPERSIGSLEFFDCLVQTNTMTGSTTLEIRQNGGSVFDGKIQQNIYLTITSGFTGISSLPQLNTNVYPDTKMYLKVSSSSTGTISGICKAHY